MSQDNTVEAVVRIECDAGQHGRRRHVTTFVKAEGEWHEALKGEDANAGRAGRHLYGHLDAELGQGPVDGSDPRAWERMTPGDGILRIRYSLECPAHRHGAREATDKQLYPILDTLAQHDVQTITLRALGARLDSS